jgi:hypothetical protein
MKKGKLKNYLKPVILLFRITIFFQNCKNKILGAFDPESNKNIQNLTFKESIDFFNQKNLFDKKYNYSTIKLN